MYSCQKLCFHNYVYSGLQSAVLPLVVTSVLSYSEAKYEGNSYITLLKIMSK